MGRSKKEKEQRKAMELARQVKTGGGLSAGLFLSTLMDEFDGVGAFCKRIRQEWDHSKAGGNTRAQIMRMVTGLQVHMTAANRGNVMGEDATDEDLEEGIREEFEKLGIDLDDDDEDLIDDHGGVDDEAETETISANPGDTTIEHPEPPLDEQDGEEFDDEYDDGEDMILDEDDDGPRLGDLL